MNEEINRIVFIVIFDLRFLYMLLFAAEISGILFSLLKFLLSAVILCLVVEISF